MAVRSSSMYVSTASCLLSTIDASMSTSMIQESAIRLGKVNFMEKRQAYQVTVDGIDYTPDNIVDPEYVTMDENFVHSAFETRAKHKSESRVAIRDSKSRSMTVATTGATVYATTINLDDIRIDHTQNTEEGYAPDTGDLDVAPSAFIQKGGLIDIVTLLKIAQNDIDSPHLLSNIPTPRGGVRRGRRGPPPTASRCKGPRAMVWDLFSV